MTVCIFRLQGHRKWVLIGNSVYGSMWRWGLIAADQEVG